MSSAWTLRATPRGIRVLYMDDRVVLEDVSDLLDDVSSRSLDRNAVIDAVNRGSRGQGRRRPCLVVPFGTSPAPFETDTVPQDRNVRGLDVVMGLLGVIQLASGSNLVLLHAAKPAGQVPHGTVYVAQKVTLIPLYTGEPASDDKTLGGEVVKLLESGYVFYSLDTDISRSAQSQSLHPDHRSSDSEFWWTRALATRLTHRTTSSTPTSPFWPLRTIYGFVGTASMATADHNHAFRFTLLSRRSRKRAGTRYITRGADSLGNVANFVETEQLVWTDRGDLRTSFCVVRGSIPVFWRQNNGLTKPPPELVPPVAPSRVAFGSHFQKLRHRYGAVVAVSLVNKHGPEKVLADAFQRHAEIDWPANDGAELVAFDFHAECHGSEYEAGLAKLINTLKDTIHAHKVYVGTSKSDSPPLVLQAGVFRVNCVDCLDRTNVIQSLISRSALNMQIYAVLRDQLGTAYAGGAPIGLTDSAESSFKRVWADNADAVSKQYSGTGALKTDVTRTGQRSTTGMLGDGVKSVMRMYYKNVVDQGRQEAIEVLCGYATGAPLPTDKDDVLFSYHDAQRVGAGGDRDPCELEIREESIMLSTAEGIRFDIPRQGLIAFERRNGVKTRPRLRLTYDPAAVGSCLVAASPVEFQFKSGGSDRERFLRSLLAWSRPRALEVYGTRVRVRIAGFTGSIPDGAAKQIYSTAANGEVLCLLVMKPDEKCRKWGLAAAPSGWETSQLQLLHCKDEGDVAMALFISSGLFESAAEVEEAVQGLDGGRGTVMALSLSVAGSSLCFVGAYFTTAGDIQEGIHSLRIGRFGFDVSSQFDHCYIAGRLGEPSQPRGWMDLQDRSSARTAPSGLGCIRYSLPRQGRSEQLENARSPLLVDETVVGRGPPVNPRAATQFVVSFRRLRGENLRTPPGIPRDTPLLGYVTFSSDYTTDSVSTSTVHRIAQTPEWEESVTLRLVPSDHNEIQRSYIFGQVLITTPVVDDIGCGTFALPVAQLLSSDRFTAAVRYGGLQGGKLSGEVSIREVSANTSDGRLGVEKRALDLKSRVSNTRKAKNMIGKVSNFISKKAAGDSGPFARPYAGGADGDYEASSTRTSSRGGVSSTSSDIEGDGYRPESVGLSAAYKAGRSSSLIDFEDFSSNLPTAERPPTRRSSRATVENELMSAFGMEDARGRTPTGADTHDDDSDLWGDFEAVQAPPSREQPAPQQRPKPGPREGRLVDF